MVGEPALDINLDKLSPDALAADIIYTPLASPFLAAASERQNKTVNGLGMLLHQGPPAWKKWFGLEPIVTEELEKMEVQVSLYDMDERSQHLQGIVIEVDESYTHCPRAFKFSDVWNTDTITENIKNRPIPER